MYRYLGAVNLKPTSRSLQSAHYKSNHSTSACAVLHMASLGHSAGGWLKQGYLLMGHTELNSLGTPMLFNIVLSRLDLVLYASYGIYHKDLVDIVQNKLISTDIKSL